MMCKSNRRYPELKPCPFCGSEDVEIGDYNSNPPHAWKWKAGCSDCGIWTDYFETKEEALNSWNARVIDDL